MGYYYFEEYKTGNKSVINWFKIKRWWLIK